jgi:hypothetical protein
MAPVHGADFVLEVETATPGTYVPVSDMDNFDDGSDATEQDFPVFGNVTYNVPGARTVTMTASGFRTLADAGQLVLLAAEKARTPVNIRVKYDGTNGYTVQVNVKTRKGNAKAEGLQTIAFDMTAAAASVAVGSGPAI